LTFFTVLQKGQILLKNVADKRKIAFYEILTDSITITEKLFLFSL